MEDLTLPRSYTDSTYIEAVCKTMGEINSYFRQIEGFPNKPIIEISQHVPWPIINK